MAATKREVLGQGKVVEKGSQNGQALGIIDTEDELGQGESMPHGNGSQQTATKQDHPDAVPPILLIRPLLSGGQNTTHLITAPQSPLVAH